MSNSLTDWRLKNREKTYHTVSSATRNLVLFYFSFLYVSSALCYYSCCETVLLDIYGRGGHSSIYTLTYQQSLINTTKQLHRPSSINHEKESGNSLPGIQRRYGQSVEEKNVLPLPGIGLKARSLVFAHCNCHIQHNCLWQDTAKIITL